jgi:hypothetical protein
MVAVPAFLSQIKEPVNREFANLWLHWRGERLLPRRADVDLNSMRRLLPLVLLIEYHSPDEARIKVAGSRLRDYLGYELTGANYVDLAEPERRPIRRYRNWEIVTRPCGSRLIYDHRMQSGQVMPAEVVSLPLDPDLPGGPRLTLANIAPLSRRTEILEPPMDRRIAVAEEFTFLDIGAGVPDSIFPPP